MTILKKGTCETSATISSTVYVCNSCGYTTMSNQSECPQCHSQLSKVTSSRDEEKPSDNPSNIV